MCSKSRMPVIFTPALLCGSNWDHKVTVFLVFFWLYLFYYRFFAMLGSS